MKEYVDIYDRNKHRTGKIIARKDINSLLFNQFVITVHCFIINSDNQILLTQRSYNQNRGGKWEDTHGGLKAGETSIKGIIRELKEEIGITVKEEELKFITTLKRKSKFRDIYVLRKDIPLKDFKYNDGEVMACKYVTLEELKKMIKKGECTFKKIEDTIFYYKDINKL